MYSSAQFTLDDTGETAILRLSGDIVISHLGELPVRLQEVDVRVATIDLSAVNQVDTIGAWIVHSLAARHNATIEGANPNAHRLIEAVAEGQDGEVPVRTASPPRFNAYYRRSEKPQSWPARR